MSVLLIEPRRDAIGANQVLIGVFIRKIERHGRLDTFLIPKGLQHRIPLRNGLRRLQPKLLQPVLSYGEAADRGAFQVVDLLLICARIAVEHIVIAGIGPCHLGILRLFLQKLAIIGRVVRNQAVEGGDIPAPDRLVRTACHMKPVIIDHIRQIAGGQQEIELFLLLPVVRIGDGQPDANLLFPFRHPGVFAVIRLAGYLRPHMMAHPHGQRLICFQRIRRGFQLLRRQFPRLLLHIPPAAG